MILDADADADVELAETGLCRTTFHPSAAGCACTGASGGRLHKEVLQFWPVLRGQIQDHRANYVMTTPGRGNTMLPAA